MTLEELFQQKALDYPISYVGDFLSALRESLSLYSAAAKNLADPAFPVDSEKVIDTVAELSACILEATEMSLDGFPARAFARLSVALDSVKSVLLSEVFKTTMSPTVGGYYRLRAFESPPQNLSCLDLFHVPFSKRTLVAPERFSLSGYPCLYLGSSSLICWHEKQQPPLDKVAVVRYEVWNDSSHPLLYLAFHPKRIPRTLRSFLAVNQLWKDDPSVPARVLYAIIVTFPLILSCHFKVQFPNDPFKPEYIIPQLVLQWLRSQTDIEGLCFVSTQVDFDQVPLPFSLNYVFPVPQQRDRYSSFLARFFSSVPFVPTQGNVDANYQTVNPGSRYFDLSRSGSLRPRCPGSA